MNVKRKKRKKKYVIFVFVFKWAISDLFFIYFSLIQTNFTPNKCENMSNQNTVVGFELTTL